MVRVTFSFLKISLFERYQVLNIYPELKWLSLNLPDLQLLPFGDDDGDFFGCSHLNDRGSLLCQAQVKVMQAGRTFRQATSDGIFRRLGGVDRGGSAQG